MLYLLSFYVPLVFLFGLLLLWDKDIRTDAVFLSMSVSAQLISVLRAATCPECLKMFGNSTLVRELSGRNFWEVCLGSIGENLICRQAFRNLVTYEFLDLKRKKDVPTYKGSGSLNIKIFCAFWCISFLKSDVSRVTCIVNDVLFAAD